MSTLRSGINPSPDAIRENLPAHPQAPCMTGSGTLWVQSLPFWRLAERIYQASCKAREEVRAGGK